MPACASRPASAGSSWCAATAACQGLKCILGKEPFGAVLFCGRRLPDEGRGSGLALYTTISSYSPYPSVSVPDLRGSTLVIVEEVLVGTTDSPTSFI